MASAGTTSFLPALSEPDEREGVGGRLQSVLIELVDLWEHA